MSSARASEPGGTVDDRTTKARIRDAAIGCIAEIGVAETTARKVAAAAGVSPGLVIHHFGSMDGLRSACDEYLVTIIRQEKEKAMASGASFDVVGALRESRSSTLTGYLAQVLVDGSPMVDHLVDDLVADAEGYLAQGVESGMLRPTSDERGRAAILTVWSLGSLVLHRHVKRLFGVDPTDPDFANDLAGLPYVGLTAEILSDGVYTEALAEQLRTAFSPDPASNTPPPESPGSAQDSREAPRD